MELRGLVYRYMSCYHCDVACLYDNVELTIFKEGKKYYCLLCPGCFKFFVNTNVILQSNPENPCEYTLLNLDVKLRLDPLE